MLTVECDVTPLSTDYQQDAATYNIFIFSLQALNEAIATATSLGVSLIIANDPDADRLAAAEYVPANDGTDGTGGAVKYLYSTPYSLSCTHSWEKR